MDYSAIHHDDPDHAANGSPWATSPRPSKAAFSPRTSTEEPPPQFPNTAMSSRQSSAPDRPSLETSQDTLDQQDDLSKGPTAVEHGVQDPFQSSTHPQRNDQAPPPPAPPQQEQPPMSQQQPQSRPRQAQRYHGNRAKSRQEQTVHRLQPKVTGIERPSRKELIVRFDIHVSQQSAVEGAVNTWRACANRKLTERQIYPVSAPLSSATSVEPTPNSSA